MANPVNDKTTLMVTRRTDVARLDTIMCALGLVRREKRQHRVDALSYVLDEFEKRPPSEVSSILKATSKAAGAKKTC